MPHTPGPWTTLEKQRWDAGQGEFLIWRMLEGTNKGTLIARVKRGYDVDGNKIHSYKRECNARLIAAAPELLEVLKELMADIESTGASLNVWPVGHPHLVKARATIAKTEKG